VARHLVGDGRVLLLTLFLSGSVVAVLPEPGPTPISPNPVAVDVPVAETAKVTVNQPLDAPPSVELDTLSDVELLAAELMIPVENVTAADLRDNFSEMRGTRRHEALDILAPRGTPVISAAAGRVLQISRSGAGGRMVFATDSTGQFLFLYAHLDDYADDLEEGMPLRRGQLLGYVGTSGNAPSNTPHLHFAIKRAGDSARWSRGTAIDPRPLFQPKQDPVPLLPEHPFPDTQPQTR
jgi:peptidoglycan LD-endopeptidase LytH